MELPVTQLQGTRAVLADGTVLEGIDNTVGGVPVDPKVPADVVRHESIEVDTFNLDKP